jgi:hypothetical protein
MTLLRTTAVEGVVLVPLAQMLQLMLETAALVQRHLSRVHQ